MARFVHDPSGNHFCTVSVVASPGRDLLITAAHCISGGKNGGYRQDLVFIPGYRDGQEPFGVWTPARLVVAPQWTASSDPDYDVGFIVLKPDDGKNIEDAAAPRPSPTAPTWVRRSSGSTARPSPTR